MVTDPETLDETLAAIADERRRRLLAILRDLDTPERLSALTRNLAAEMDLTSPAEIRKLRIRLHHVHVPKLTDVGIVRYDRGQGTVELTEKGRDVANALPR